MKRIGIVGESLAALVAAHKLSENQRNHVTLYTGGRHPGGIFASRKVGEYSLDVGMVFIELTSFNQDSSAEIGSYRAEVRGDSGRFVFHIRKYLESLPILMNDIPSPKMYYRGKIYPDPIISNHLDFLLDYSDEVRQRILKEIDQPQNKTLHAKNKDQFKKEGVSYLQASIANHGSFLTEEIFRDFSYLITGCKIEDLSAFHHRLFWMPLFYPETIQETIDKKSPPQFKTIFSYPKSGSIGDITKKIMSLLETRPNFNLDVRPFGKESLVLKNSTTLIAANEDLQFDRIILGTSLSSLSVDLEKDLPEVKKSPIKIVSIALPHHLIRSDMSSLFVHGNPFGLYRVTMQSGHARDTILHFEFRDSEQLRHMNEAEILKMVTNSLIEMGLIESKIGQGLQPKMLANATPSIAFPTFQNLVFQGALAEKVPLLAPNVDLIGGAAPYGAHSFNDQIVQGLKVALHIQNEFDLNPS